MPVRIKTSLGFSVDVDDDGRFNLPDRQFTAAELKKVARDVNRAARQDAAAQQISEMEDADGS